MALMICYNTQNRLVTLSSRLVDGGLCVQELYNCQKKVPRVRNIAKYIEV